MYVEEFIGWLKYPGLLSAFLVIFALVGLPNAALLARRDQRLLGLAPVFGMCWLGVAGAFYAYTGLAMNQFAAIAAVCALGAAGAVMIVRTSKGRRLPEQLPLALALPRREQAAAAARTAMTLSLPWVIGVVLCTVMITPIITSDLAPPGYLTSFTGWNNDLGFYIAGAANLQAHGYSTGVPYELTPLLGPDLKLDHGGAVALLSAISTITGLAVWQVATVLVMSTVCTLFYSVYYFVRAVFRFAGPLSLVVSMAATMSTLIWFAAAQAYLAQLIVMTAVAAQAGLAYWLTRTGQLRLLPTAVVPLIAMGALASLEGQIVGLYIVGAASLVAVSMRDRIDAGPVQGARNVVRSLVIWWAVTGAIVLIVLVPFLTAMTQWLQAVSQPGLLGTPRDLTGFAAGLIGLDAAGSSDRSGNGLDLAAIVIAGAVTVSAFVILVRRGDPMRIAGYLAIAFLVPWVALAVLYGPTEYQSWKMAISVAPLVFALFAGVIFQAFDGDLMRPAVTGAALLIVGSSVAGAASDWSEFTDSQIGMNSRTISAELSSLLSSDLLQHQPGVNLKLEPYFVSMSGPSVLNRPAAMLSMSYEPLFTPAQGYPFPCTVALKSQAPKPLPGPIAFETENYVVFGTPACS